MGDAYREYLPVVSCTFFCKYEQMLGIDPFGFEFFFRITRVHVPVVSNFTITNSDAANNKNNQ